MNNRIGIRNAIIILILAAATVLPVSALGRREQGYPEPVPVKDVPEASGGAVKEKSDNAYPPAGWVTDIREAYRLAQNGDKKILVDFTGSDWCVWCKKLSSEVFNTPEFQAYAEENLVMLFLDFPQGLTLPEEQVQHNQIIAQLLGVRGYPTIWLLGSDLSPLLSTGYREGGAEEYIRHLENDRPDISPEDSENFRLGFTEAIEVNIGPLD